MSINNRTEAEANPRGSCLYEIGKERWTNSEHSNECWVTTSNKSTGLKWPAYDAQINYKTAAIVQVAQIEHIAITRIDR